MTLTPTEAGAGVFTYEALPGRVVFGVGALEQLGAEVDRLGARRVLLVASERLADELAERLGGRLAATVTEIVQHVPVEVADRARRLARQAHADAVVSVGGGSAVGLAKAVALDLAVPIVAVPTTYAGSELTTIYGLTEGGRKQTGRDPRVLPKVVLYDPILTVSLPPQVTGRSGMNALAHCVEAHYGPGANPITTLLAEEGIRALAAGLPQAVEQPDDLDGRGQALRGAWLAGTALAAAGTGIHHQICHVLGGAFGLDHGGLHAVVLPHAARFVTPAVSREMARVAAALGVADAALGCFRLARLVGAPASLAELGMAEADLDRAAELCAGHVAQRPRPAGVQELRDLLGAAYAGQQPEPP
jgi:maleylacetate reductase